MLRKHFTDSQLLELSYKKIEELESKLRSKKRDNLPWIVGISFELPGGVHNFKTLNELLSERKTGISSCQDNRFQSEWDSFSNLLEAPKIQAGFIQDPFRFHAAYFNISGREAKRMDPQQRLALHFVKSAVESSGLKIEELSEKNVGVFMSSGEVDYAKKNCQSFEKIDGHSKLGATRSVGVGRIAYAFGFEGPSFFVDTSCSSTHTAVHLASQSISSGECDYAVVVAVSLLLSLEDFIGFSSLGALSPVGVCSPFSSEANGYVRGEGGGALFLMSDKMLAHHSLKPLARIVGSALNHDGKSNGLTAPNLRQQEKVLNEALHQAQINGEEVAHIEAHGTGTALGDPIELMGIVKGYKLSSKKEDDSTYVSSIKANIGHLEAASGIPSFAKTLLMMHTSKIFPQANFQKENKDFLWDENRICIPKNTVTLDEGKKFFALSGFGMSGTNSHILLEKPSSLLDLMSSQFISESRQKYDSYEIKEVKLNPQNQTFLPKEHLVFDEIVVPCTALIEEFFLKDSVSCVLSDLKFLKMQKNIENLRLEKTDFKNLMIKDSRGQVIASGIKGPKEDFKFNYNPVLSFIETSNSFYARFLGGVQPKGQFQSVLSLYEEKNSDAVWGMVQAFPYRSGRIHPATLDGCLQIASVIINSEEKIKKSEAFVPIAIREYRSKAHENSPFYWSKIEKIFEKKGKMYQFTVKVFDLNFDLMVEFREITFIKTSNLITESIPSGVDTDVSVLYPVVCTALAKIIEADDKCFEMNKSFTSFGVDSIMLVELMDDLARDLQVDLSNVSPNPSQTIAQLIDGINSYSKEQNIEVEL